MFLSGIMVPPSQVDAAITGMRKERQEIELSSATREISPLNETSELPKRDDCAQQIGPQPGRAGVRGRKSLNASRPGSDPNMS